MKRLFHIVMLFFALAISFLLEPSAIQAQPIDTIGTIQGVQKETVVLVSNNIFNGEITSNQQKNDQNFSGSVPLVLAYQPVNNLFDKNKTQLNGCFIHNLSTDKQKVHQIRAP